MSAAGKEALNADKTSGNLLSKRLNKILDTRLENDKDTLEALKELSTFFSENTLKSRRNLRSKIEKRSLAINEDFLSSFKDVKEALDLIHDDVMSMNDCILNMTNRLKATKTQTQQLIDQTTKLQSDSLKLSLQQEVAGAFQHSFQLSPAEQKVLREASVNADFFAVLDRVHEIHSNCRVLMQAGHQTAALEVMEQMALYQEAALERLYRWTQNHCRGIESADTSLLLTQAMSYLQDRPVLFKYVTDEYCTVRRALLVHSFLLALTQGGPSGTPKPIEMHAHDPKRYVGDMLAWLHQSVPGERDNLLTLLKGCDNIDVMEKVQEALATITEGVCHPLKVRVEQILGSGVQPIVLYAIANLLHFYRDVIKQVVSECLLESTLKELQEQARQAFLATLQNQVKVELVDGVETPPPDLVPAPGVTRLLLLLREVLSVASMAETRQRDLTEIAACILDPLLRAVNESAARLPTCDMAVYLLNCLYQMQSTLSLYEFMDERLERLQAQSDAQLDTLASEQASSLVANLNLGPMYTILQEHSKGGLVSVPGMEPANLNNFMVKLDGFLALPDVLLLPQVNMLLSGTHRATTQRRAFEVISAIYRKLYDAVFDPSNRYHDPESLLPRTPDQVHKVLVG